MTDRVAALTSGISKIHDHLADGRELIYYFDRDTQLARQVLPDQRALEPRSSVSSMRFDRLTDEWITMATSRQNRVFLPPAEMDPLAPQSASNPSEIPSRYDVAVFENRSPAFGPNSTFSRRAPRPNQDVRPAWGRCEVVSFAPEADGSLGSQPIPRIRTVVEAWVDRTTALQRLPHIRQVFPFENRGEQIGVTLHHPHGQIYGYPFIAPRTRQVLSMAEKNPHLFHQILESEQAGERIVLQSTTWTAYVPFAARWPIEIHVLPHRHIPDLSETNQGERADLAVLLKRLLTALDHLYGDATPYIAAWHQAPVGREEMRLSLQITSPRRAADRYKYLAGSEAAMGAWVADLLPEEVAARLREAIDV